jgi:fructuronate reductase
MATNHDTKTVAEAIAQPRYRTWVDEFWDEAATHLDPVLEIDAYRAALVRRFENAGIEHRLEQIAEDGERKLRFRIVPVAAAEIASGRPGGASARPIAAWLEHQGMDTREGLQRLSPALAGDDGFVRTLNDLRVAVP